MHILQAKKQVPQSKEGSEGTVQLAGRAVAYTVKRSDRAKNLRLQVGLETGLEVIAPKKFDLGDLQELLRNKQKWILDKLDYFTRMAEDRKASPQQLGNRRVLYRGREFEVEIIVVPGTARTVEVEERKLVVIMPEGAEGDAGAVLERWFRAMARLLIHQRLRVVNDRLNLSFNRVFIKGQKTRWGSCSQQGNLNFNWRLVMAPLPVLDYVVVHELLHLVEPNHSKRFWALVEGECPDYKVHRAWLRNNGAKLSL